MEDWTLRKYQKSNFIYHFTSVENARAILNDKLIRMSTARIPRFGTGVFSTMLDPDSSTCAIISNNYRGNYKYSRNAECAFALEKRSVNYTKITDRWDPKRDLYRIDHHGHLENINYYLILRDNNRL